MSTPVKVVASAAVVLVIGVGAWLVRPLLVDDVVDDAFPMSAGAVVPDDMTAEEVEAEMVAAAEGDDTEEVEAMPDGEVVAVLEGGIAGADELHEGEGSATLYRLDDGSHVLRFEDFRVTNGPDLHVFLTELDSRGQPSMRGEVVDLGSLRGNVGDQNYPIPAEVPLALDGPIGVTIYCVPFSVLFASAVLA